MGISKAAKMLDAYFERLNSGKAAKIKAKHVKAVIEKLKRRKRALQEEAEATRNDAKKARLKRKIRVAREQIRRAKWLLDEIGDED